MRIRYLGHACFSIKGCSEVVTDPFTGIGLPEPQAEADLVLCSHEHRDHSYVGKTAKKDALVLKGFVGSTQHGCVKVRGVPSFHDEERGAKRGPNTIYVFEMDGLTLCHLGDLGQELSQEELESVGHVDILFVPVGGFYTIGPETASRVCDSIAPRIVIPMHYRTPRHSPAFDRLSTVDDFASLRKNVKRPGRKDMEVTPEELPEEVTTVILES